MRTFQCEVCEQALFFENVQCTRCGASLAFLPERRVIAAFQPSEQAGFVAQLPGGERIRYRMCSNHSEHCSWAVDESDEQPFCRSCRLNVMIPNLSQAGAKEAWTKLERAKRRLLYTLMDIGLPIEPRTKENDHGLGFAFMADRPDAPVFTGQSNGVITINIAEADTPFREKIRHRLGEPYRTLLGHFRHEIGHYYWDRLIRDRPIIGSYRTEFGDERTDYQVALERHYQNGAPSDWPTNFVSAYASSHPWEDWAETWAHYLHLMDALDTAQNYRLVVSPVGNQSTETIVSTANLDFADFGTIIQAWMPLTIALNSLNRSMGLPDMYPFVLSTAALRKLRFVHDLVQRSKVRPDSASS